jgi:hypothetical protein
VQAILVAVSDTGGGWVGWVILAVIFGFIALFLFGDMRARLKNRLIKRRSRYQVPRPAPLATLHNLRGMRRPRNNANEQGVTMRHHAMCRYE